MIHGEWVIKRESDTSWLSTVALVRVSRLVTEDGPI